jgi:hypothetical protein
MPNARRLVLPFIISALTLTAGRLPGQVAGPPPSPGGEAVVVAPGDFVGFPIGADFKLVGWDSIGSYLSQLAATSPAARIDTLGRTTQGRPFLAFTVSTPENIARLGTIRANQAKLADPRGLSDDELESLLESQPAVVVITHNIHSTEIASSQGVMELAYSLATERDMQTALQNVVAILLPSVNPDGQQMVTEWYARTLGTPYEGTGMPWLYHPYVGHDNNRDFFMLTQVESRMVNDLLYQEWFPEIVYDIHQMGNRGARLFIPPFDDPVNPNLDPLIVRMISLAGLQMSTDLEAAGKSGVVNSQRFDLWWHGGLRTVPARHNMIGILSESASARLASPIFQEPEEFENETRPTIAYPDPWSGGWWRIRDIIDYQQIACRSLIAHAARQRRQLIHNYVEVGRRAIEAGRSEPPFAYIVPRQQRDVGAAVAMLRLLQRGGVEVHRAQGPFAAAGVDYQAGDWVVLMAQPYRAHAKDLLERQKYPDLRVYPGGPPDAPYDVAGWTLPLQMGVEAVEVASPFEAELELETAAVHPPSGSVTGTGSAYIVANATNAANLAIHRTLAAGGAVTLLTEALAAGDRTWPAGSAVLSGPEVRDLLSELADSQGLSASALSGRVTGTHLGDLRVGLYQPWTASMDEGWARWVFDSWELPYETLHDAEIRAGALRQRYSAIILPDLSPRSIVEGRQPGSVPPEYAGGLGDTGVQALREFVRSGGTLICLDASTDFAIEQFGLAVEDILPPSGEQRSGRAFYAPGSIMSVSIDPSHPLGYGMPERTAIYYSNSPLFSVADDADGVTVVATYPDEGQLLSGYAINPDFLAGKAALVESSYGDGNVILFGFRPHYRGQSHETFKVLFNAVYSSAAEASQTREF